MRAETCRMKESKNWKERFTAWFSPKKETTQPYIFLKDWLGYMPHDTTLFKRALTHRSGHGSSNEQLEYLGDAVIGMVIADALYHLFPRATEGYLSRTRAKAVCRENLNKTAVKMGIPQHIISSAPLKSNAEDIYGNAFEALTGAIWLDGGYEQAERFLHRWLIGKKQEYLLRFATAETDYKSRLLEWGQTERKQIEFVQLSERYEKHRDRHVFLCVVRIDGPDYAQGAGYNKLEAQQTAAKKTYQQLRKQAK